jgi:putative FmdB family regulatory protein
MPVYTYRREDGTTFDIRQKFADEPLSQDPETGQKVVRVVQSAGVIFKGSGFYVTDSKSASKSAKSTTTQKDSTSTEKAADDKSTKTEKTNKSDKSESAKSA